MRRVALALLIWFLILSAIDLLDRTEARLDRVDLGVARYPASLQGGEPTSHEWRDVARRRPYRLGYLHGAAAAAALAADHAALGRRFGFKRLSDSRIQFRVERGCRTEPWGCIYSEILERSRRDLAPVAERIGLGARGEPWTSSEIAAWLLDFVQRIPYRVPEDDPFGVRPTALVVSDAWGDCDSKSLLLIHLLDTFGIDAVLLSSQAHAHALVGIAVPTSGSYFEYQGRRYAWAETTAEDSPLGWRSPRLKRPDDWQVIPVR